MYTLIFVYFHMKFNIRTWILRVEAYFFRLNPLTPLNVLQPAHVEDWAECAKGKSKQNKQNNKNNINNNRQTNTKYVRVSLTSQVIIIT